MEEIETDCRDSFCALCKFNRCFRMNICEETQAFVFKVGLELYLSVFSAFLFISPQNTENFLI